MQLFTYVADTDMLHFYVSSTHHMEILVILLIRM